MSEQKYRQRGYRDDDADRPSKKQGPPRGRREGPWGRGLGAPTATVFRCAVCGARQSSGDVDFESTCHACGADLHTCTHCQHFDTSAAAECRQPVVERIGNKAKRNQCELWSPKAAKEFADEAKPKSPGEAKAAFDDLFKF